MYFLLESCENPAILRTLYFGLLFKDIIFMVIPIGLILMLLIDFSKAVVSGDADEQRKKINIVPKRILYAAIVFLIPWVVNVLMNLLEGAGLKIGSDYNLCINNAKNGDFEYFDNLEEEEKKSTDYFSSITNTIIDSVDNIQNKAFNTLLGKNKADNVVDEMIRIAKLQVGLDNSNGTYGPKGYAWCAYFTTWVIKNTNVNDVNLYNNIVAAKKQYTSAGSCGSIMYHFDTTENLKVYYSRYYAKKNSSRSADLSYIPKKGDLIFFWWHDGNKYHPKGDWDGKLEAGEYLDHIGIVEKVDGNKVYTIEGNCSNKVKMLSYDLDSNNIVGYGSWYDENGTDYLEKDKTTDDSGSKYADSGTLNGVKKEIESYIKKKDYNISIGYYDINSKYTYTYNTNKIYYGASTIKTLDALYYYTHNKPSNIKENDIKIAIEESNNDAHIRNIDAIGIEKYRNYGVSLGVSSTIMNTVKAELGSFGNTNVDTQFIYLKKLVSVLNNNKDREKIKGYFINSKYNCLEYSGSPVTMHKYGAKDNYFHDVGIVLDSSGNPSYIVVILTNGFSDANCGNAGGKSKESSITELSKLIYKLHQGVQKKNIGVEKDNEKIS